MPTHRLTLFLCLLTCIGLALSVSGGTRLVTAHPLLAPAAAQPSRDGENLELVGQTGGAIHALAARGNYLYVGAGPRLLVLDTSDPANLRLVGQSPVFPDFVMSIALDGDFAYVAAGRAGLRILDIADPSAPTEVGFYQRETEEVGVVAVTGGHAYLASREAGLRVIDVTTPASPSNVATLDMAGGVPTDIAIVDGYAYLTVSNRGGLIVLDVTTASAPREVGRATVPGRALAIDVANNHAYVVENSFNSSEHRGLTIFDVTDPTNPQARGSLSRAGFADVVAIGTYAYLSDSISGVAVMGVSNPSQPASVGYYYWPHQTIDVGPSINVLAKEGSRIYATVLTSFLHILDVQEPTAPAEIGTYSSVGQAFRLDVAGEHAYVSHFYQGMSIYDVTNGATPTEVSRYEAAGAYALTVAGDYAYLSANGLRILDVSNPSSVVEVAHHPNGASDALVDGDTLYRARQGLYIEDVSDPTSIERRATAFTEVRTYRMALAGDRLYLADDEGLRIADVSDPTAPRQLGRFETPGVDGSQVGRSQAVAVQGDFAYLTASGDWNGTTYVGRGLYVIDVSNPGAPRQTAFIETNEALDVVVKAHYLYLADTTDSGGLIRAFDASNPAAPQEIDSYETAGYPFDLAVSGDRIFIADEKGGLLILRHAGPTMPLPDKLYLPLVQR